MKNPTKVTFIFQSGRKGRLEKHNAYAKDMFYTFFNFKNEFDTDLIEFGGFNDTKFNWFLFYFEREFVRRFLKIPLFATFLTNKMNYEKIINSDQVIMSSQRVACSTLPMIIKARLSRKKTKFNFFVMGMFSSKPKYKIFIPFQSIYFKVLIYLSNNVFFIGRGEYEFAIKKHKLLKSKFSYISFGVDTDFWSEDNEFESKDREGILFVGNDSNRDLKLLLDIAEELNDIKFTFLTSQIFDKKIPNNVELIKGSWGENELSDTDVKELYLSHRLTLVPLIESLQPSGQSVTLQSMSVGTPVVLSKTSGLWDTKNLVDNVNILLIENNTLDEWINVIKINYYDNEKLKMISKQSTAVVEDALSLDLFYNQIKSKLEL